MNLDTHVQKQIARDIEELAELGYSQELYRSIGGFSNFAITFSIISVLSGLLTLYDYGLYLVGPLNIWTWGVVSFFQMLMALALGEIVSAYPVAGGVYKWTELLGNPRVAWFTGVFSLIGWLACTAGIQFGLAIFLTSYFGFNYYDMRTVLLATIIIITLHTVINIFGIRIVAWFNELSVKIHFIGVIILVSLLFVFGQNQSINIFFNQAEKVDSQFFVRFVQALLMSAWTLTAFDAAANVSEESINPSKVVPWGMIFAVLASIVLGGVLLLSINLALPDLGNTLQAGVPAVLYIIKSALGTTIYRFVVVFILLAQFTAGLSAQTVLIRILYSFARDGNMPFSNCLKKISPRYETPRNSALLAAGATLLLCSLSAFLPQITSISTLGIYFSYAIVLGVALINRQKLQNRRGAFHLGKFSIYIQYISFFWAVFVTAIMVIPPFGSNGKSFVYLLMLSVFLYFLKKKHFGKKEDVEIIS